MSRILYDGIDWAVLCEQKDGLIAAIDKLEGQPEHDALQGILGLLDHLMDTADEEGEPVIFNTECDHCGDIFTSNVMVECHSEMGDKIKLCGSCFEDLYDRGRLG